jgi:hypothetical protein
MNEEKLLCSIFGEEYVPDGTENKFVPANLVWGWCRMCGAYLKCPKCGNNLCNGGYGTLDEERKVPCDLCTHMYELQDFYDQTKQYPKKEDFIKV